MKWNAIYTVFVALLMGVSLMNYSGGPAGTEGTGNTGAPGDEMIGPFAQTCVTCHGGSSITTELTIEVLDADEDPVSEYVPGETYRVKVSHNVTAGSPQAYGFQIVSLLNSNDSDVAGFSNPDNNTQIATANNGRQYAEHDGPNSNTDFFEVDWTAPEVGSGGVTFYSCGNAVNLNGSTTGDGADCATLSLDEGMSSSINELVLGSFTLVPNPVETQAMIQFQAPGSGQYLFSLLDLQGRTHWQAERSLINGAYSESLDLSSLAAGIYFLSIRLEDRIFTTRVIKQ